MRHGLSHFFVFTFKRIKRGGHQCIRVDLVAWLRRTNQFLPFHRVLNTDAAGRQAEGFDPVGSLLAMARVFNVKGAAIRDSRERAKNFQYILLLTAGRAFHMGGLLLRCLGGT